MRAGSLPAYALSAPKVISEVEHGEDDVVFAILLRRVADAVFKDKIIAVT
eukprot:m.5426 g.5426  ORF g.5426 m.5426 type:complete len:50 (+) comp7655_c0_seq1:319-468(+)